MLNPWPRKYLDSAFYFDPATGRRFDQGGIETPNGDYQTKGLPSPQDWVLVIKHITKH